MTSHLVAIVIALVVDKVVDVNVVAFVTVAVDGANVTVPYKKKIIPLELE